ncbi:MAG TPA: outer-membrane lipoprotein carrier protein LolA, partial [Dissulfurispiraceae bacterium]|nr:outer-membrane lipoprotein carrier protein LolA [Dissulfurispiraceae bacterium]
MNIMRNKKERALSWGIVAGLVVMLLGVMPPSSFALSADEEIKRIQGAYEGIKDIRGDFVQKSRISDLKRMDTYSGQFFIKASKMRWDFKGDKVQSIYIRGDEIVIYQKMEKQAFKSKFDRSTYGQAPIALLGGFGNIRKEFDVTAKEGKLVLKPKMPMGNVVTVEITTSRNEFPIESVTIVDSSSNRVEVRLKNVRTNSGVKDSVFEFTPPEGVTVFQQ